MQRTRKSAACTLFGCAMGPGPAPSRRERSGRSGSGGGLRRVLGRLLDRLLAPEPEILALLASTRYPRPAGVRAVEELSAVRARRHAHPARATPAVTESAP